jgi:hypothetical protein
MVLILLGLIFVGAGAAPQHSSRPRVELVDAVHTHQPFTVRIVSGMKPVAFCLRLNVSIRTANGLEDAPRPVDIEAFDAIKKKWFLDTSNVPDIGIAFSPVVLQPNQSRTFRLLVDSAGDYRFKLRYTEDVLQPSCPLGKNHKTAASPTVHIGD